nr:coiled-coil domain-containing protein 162-like [Pelodiscus sinensis]|eukprot:XP_025040495.1 coiled-coil domain-containing protein 162-like [Pelodiscus sinensis]
MIDSLQNPLDPNKVAQLLIIQREVTFLQFDAAVRHLLRTDTLYPAMRAITRHRGTEDEFEGLVTSSQSVLPPKGASEMEINTLQLQKLLESLEIHMIHDVQKKITLEMSLVTSERARAGTSLPTELWKHRVMQERFSVVRPQVVETFVQKLMENYQESDVEITFKKSHLQKCLTALGCDIMARERSNFETYSMFYENLLQQEHQLLYQKEQELHVVEEGGRQNDVNLSQVGCGDLCSSCFLEFSLMIGAILYRALYKHIKTITDQKSLLITLFVIFTGVIAELSHEMIMEITALRARLTNVEKENICLKEGIRKEVQDEYETLVQNLFVTCLNLKGKLDGYRLNMSQQVFQIINEVKKEGIDKMINLKKKSGSTKGDDELKEHLSKVGQRVYFFVSFFVFKCLGLYGSTKLLDLKVTEFCGGFDSELGNCLVRLQDQLQALQDENGRLGELVYKLKALSCWRQTLLKAQLHGKLRNAEKKHLLWEVECRLTQEARSRQQLDVIKAANIEKMMENMGQKEQRLRCLTEDAEKSSKIVQLQQKRIKKEMRQIKSQLIQERRLKLDAFQRVDELQCQIYDLEAVTSQRNSSTGAVNAISKERE